MPPTATFAPKSSPAAARRLPLQPQKASPFMRTPATPPAPASFTVCVFCGSSRGDDPRFAAAARDLGLSLARARWSLVFGGGDVGLMGETARAVSALGQPVHGVLPEFLQQQERPMNHGESLELTTDLQSRKRRLLTIADAFVLLPGGFGTLDEFFEVLTEAQLGVHRKPIILIDIAGYYTPLLTLLEHVVRHGFARPESLELVRRVPDVVTAIESLRPHAPDCR
jgi:uncharacterized protein (TIGR00730 family)